MSATLSHQGLPPDLRRVDLFKLTKQHGPALGIRHATLSVLLHLLNSVMIEDLEAGAICGVWETDKTIAEKTGNSERTVRRALKSLADMEAIALTSLKGGRRFGVREPSGKRHITLLKGINLGPFIDQWVPKLLEAHKEHERQRQSFDQLRLKAGSLWKAICALQDHDLVQRALDILPHGRPSRVTCLAKLEAIIKSLASLLLPTSSEQAVGKEQSGRTERPSRTVKMAVPYYNSQKNQQRGCPAVVDATWRRLLVGASKADLIETAAQFGRELGVSREGWAEACGKLGRVPASVLLCVVYRNHHLPTEHPARVVNGWRCFQSLVERAGSDPQFLRRFLFKNRDSVEVGL